MTRKWIAAVLCVLLLSLAGQAAAERLQYGSAGPKVLALQQKLAALSFYDDVLDGKYGYKTYLAVKKFQESAGLQADGIAGPKTLEMIGLAAPPLSAEVYQAGDTGGRISEIQGRLNALGYLTGSETGIFDEDTLKAVLAFQKTNALPENGIVDGVVLALMDSAAAYGKSIANWQAGLSILRLQLFDFYDAVAEVQELLFNLDYLDVTDGYYWESTRDAVKLFQAKHGLPADGMVGPATYQALTSPGAMKKSDSAPGPVKLLYGKSEGYLVIILQDTLTRLHYYSGPVSGQFDYATYRSVREFQQYNGLKVDGVVGPQTWAKINDPSAVPKP